MEATARSQLAKGNGGEKVTGDMIDEEELTHSSFVWNRQGLAARQAQLDQIYEEHMERQSKERLELYDVNFKSELEDYRRRRETEVSSLYNSK
jgi:hypothetical protein